MNQNWSRWRIRCLKLLFATMLCWSSQVWAGPSDFWSMGDNGQKLIRVDKADGSVIPVGPSLAPNRSQTTVFTPDGTLWTSFTSNGFSFALGKLDKTTGTLTQVGTGFSTFFLALLAADSSGNMFSMSYGGSLYSIDTTAGTSSYLVTTDQPGFGDIAFDSSNTLWGVSSGRLYTINMANGQTTLQSTLSGIIGNRHIAGLAFDHLGNLFLTDIAPGETSNLYSVNPTTGVATWLGDTGDVLRGGDFEPTQIPLPAVLWLGLAGFGGVLIVRRKFMA